MQLENFILW